MWVCFLQNREVMLKPILQSTLCGAAVVLFASSAWAQFSVRFWEREYVEGENDERKDWTDGFNKEECEAGMTMTFEYTFTGSLSEGDLYVYIGSGCEDKTNRDEGRCYPLIENQTLQTSAYIDVHPAPVVEPTAETPTCAESEGASDLYFFVMADDSAQTIVYQQQFTINYDTLPPDPPVDIEGEYGERMIRLSWGVSEPDFLEEWDNFRVVCWGGDHTPVVDASTDTSVTDTVDDVDLDTSLDVPADVPDDTGVDALDDLAADTVDDADLDTTGPDTTGPDTTSPDTTTSSDVTSDGAAGVCPDGGFSEGDEYISSYSCSGELGSSTRVYELRGLTNNVPYKVSVVAIDAFGNESVIGAIVCATPSEVDDFWEVYKKSGGGDDGGFCFVATAAYGDYDHPAVRWLRAYRDEVLVDLPGGRAAISRYYRTSPPLASWLREHPGARTVSRAALYPMAAMATLAVTARRNPVAAVALVLGLAMCVLCLGARGLSGTGRRG